MVRVLAGLTLFLAFANPFMARAARIDFWNEQRRGADYQNRTPTRELCSQRATVTTTSFGDRHRTKPRQGRKSGAWG